MKSLFILAAVLLVSACSSVPLTEADHAKFAARAEAQRLCPTGVTCLSTARADQPASSPYFKR